MLSLLPGNRIPDIKFDWFKPDTLVHFIMYAVLSFLMFISFYHQKNELFTKQVLYIIVSCIIIGTVIEILQGTIIVKRYFSWADILFNTIGTLIGYLTFRVYKKKELNLVRFLQ
ncbi:MAG: VanZ family protein [Crocinitomicaceae bacterium]